MTLETVMSRAKAAQASDLILAAGKPPCVYVHGQLEALDHEPLRSADLDEMLRAFLSEAQLRQLDAAGDVDLSHGNPDIGRVRINVHRQRGSLAAAVRFLSSTIPSFEELNLPGKLRELAQLPRGLVLVTGNTGSGKSTTLAAMIEYVNLHFERHVITLEDPIEFVFKHQRSVIEQRQIGDDSPSFAQALRHVVRQKPDVILVGEMRDRETIATALTAAETGHLVLGTLHTSSAAQTIERVVDVFDAGHQPQIRIQLANTLQAVICQTLLRCADRPGMVPAVEIMVTMPALRRAIRESDSHLIPGMIETGHKLGMCTLDQALADLVTSGTVALDDAVLRSREPERLLRMVGRTASVNTTKPAVETVPGDDSPFDAITATGDWH